MKRHHLLLIISLTLCFCSNTEAAQCSASFPDGLQTTSNSGSINFANNSQLHNSPDNVLDTYSITGGGVANSCYTGACSEQNSSAATLNPGAFLSSASSTNLTVAANGSATIAQAQYRTVAVGSGGALNGSSAFSQIRMTTLIVNTNAVLRLTAGDYWISNLSMSAGSSIVVNGSGTVRLFVQNTPTLANGIIFNVVPPASNQQFFLYSYSAITLANNTQFNGLLYSASALTLGNNSVINGALSASSTITISNNTIVYFDQNAVNYADLGSLCSAASLAPVGYWQMEQTTWSGSSKDVIDSSANALHGRSINGAQSQIATPALSGNPGTCRYGNFVGSSNQYINITHNSQHNFDSAFTAMAWIYLRSYNSGGLRSMLSKDSNYEMHVYRDGRLNWWMQGASFTGDYYSTVTIPLNQWRHVTFRFQKGLQDFFINGSRDAAARKTYNGSLILDTDPLQIGQDQNFSGRQWDGYIDEVRIYNRPLSDSEIVAASSERHACASVDHYRFEWSSTDALTCSAKSITIKACADSSCATLASSASTVTPNASNGAIWSNVPTFTGSVNATLQKTTAGTTTIGISSASPTALNPPQCFIGGVASSCQLDFKNSGFMWTFPATNISGTTPFITANKSLTNVQLQAVRTDATTQNCAPAFVGTRNVSFSSSYLSPASGSLSVSINGTALTSAPTLALTFDANARTSLTLHYADAGQVQVNATYTGSIANGDSGLVLTGNTSVVSKPAGFCVQPLDIATQSTAQSPCNNSACALYQRAGENFPLRTRAMAWQADNENGEQLCSGNTITPNFIGTINLTPSMSDGGNNGVLALNTATISTNGEVIQLSQHLSEVGRFQFTSSGNYFGLTLPTDVSASYGRFSPFDFAVTINNYTPACGTFTYAGLSSKLGQPFLLNGTVTARNKQSNTTQNYQGAYAKLDGGSVALSDLVGGTPSALGDFIAPHSLTFSNGAATFSPASAIYQMNAANAPLAIQLQATASDSDGITGNGTSAATMDFRLGRLSLSNAYGPELLALIIPLRTEYFDGNRYRVNTLDNCSTYNGSNASLANFNGNLNSGETMINSPLSTATVVLGNALNNAPLQLSAPGQNNDGNTTVSLAVPSWLQFDWNNTASAQTPSAIATFGRYRGSDRIIYWKEKR